MNVCFDTSTLVAALLEQHPHHPLAFRHFQSVHAQHLQGHLTTHALAELFSALTALPLKPRLLPRDVLNILQKSVLPHFTMIPLNVRDYEAALELTSSANLASGAIYDALHIIGARRAGCAKLYTLNLRHFQLLAPGDDLISAP